MGTTLNKENYISIDDYEKENNISNDRLVEMIRAGELPGRLMDDKWYVDKALPVNLDNNTSGKGESELVPDEVKKWNWGAFLLCPIWSVSNNVFIGLLSIIPFVGFVVAIILGAKGSDLAWQKKQWESIEHFQQVQRKWAIGGIVVAIPFTILLIISIISAVI